jgi:hypothetical protein
MKANGPRRQQQSSEQNNFEALFQLAQQNIEPTYTAGKSPPPSSQGQPLRSLRELNDSDPAQVP